MIVVGAGGRRGRRGRVLSGEISLREQRHLQCLGERHTRGAESLAVPELATSLLAA